MPLNPDALGTESAPAQASWSSKDSLLYALGVGAGAEDPGAELEFTTENSADVVQRALPTMPVVVSPAEGGMKSIFGALGDVDMTKLVHGAQSVVLHEPMAVEGTATLVARISALHDKGSAAVVAFENQAVAADDGRPLWTVTQTAFIRGAGGWGGDRGPSGPTNVAPERAPDHIVRYRTKADQALLYRLSGDRNPLHSDPAFAARAGFDRPILHGLCTYGFTGRALLHSVCGGDPSRFHAIEARFSRPVTPGQELEIRMWDDGDGTVFQTWANDQLVLDGGRLVHDRR